MIGLSTLQARAIGVIVAIIALFSIAVAIYSTGVTSGEQSVQAKWDRDKIAAANVERAMLRQHAEKVADLIEQQKTTNLKVSTTHEKELAELRGRVSDYRLRADRAGGLRIAAPACPDPTAVNAEADRAIGHYEATAATVRIPADVERRLWELAERAEEVTAQARACQHWISLNGFYGSKTTESAPLLDRMIAAPNQTEGTHGN